MVNVCVMYLCVQKPIKKTENSRTIKLHPILSPVVYANIVLFACATMIVAREREIEREKERGFFYYKYSIHTEKERVRETTVNFYYIPCIRIAMTITVKRNCILN